MMPSSSRSSHSANAAFSPALLMDIAIDPRPDLIVTPGTGVASLPSLGRAPRRVISLISCSRRSSDDSSAFNFDRIAKDDDAFTFLDAKASAKAVHFGRPDLGAAPI